MCVQFHFAPWVEVLPPGRLAEGAPESPTRGGPGDDDPFFLSDAPGGDFVAPAKTAPVVEEPLVEEAAPLTDAAPAPEPLPPDALTPEALVAETMADDWAIADAAPAASPTAPPPARRAGSPQRSGTAACRTRSLRRVLRRRGAAGGGRR